MSQVGRKVRSCLTVKTESTAPSDSQVCSRLEHGHANAMFVLGGVVRGARVYGQWPGLAREQLYEGRDLALTTDFRDVFAELIASHLGNQNLTSVFPGFDAQPANFLGLLQS